MKNSITALFFTAILFISISLTNIASNACTDVRVIAKDGSLLHLTDLQEKAGQESMDLFILTDLELTV